MKRRVVITGMGSVTPIGLSVEETWRNLLAGKSGIRPIHIFDAETFPTTFAAQVPDFDLARPGLRFRHIPYFNESNTLPRLDQCFHCFSVIRQKL